MNVGTANLIGNGLKYIANNNVIVPYNSAFDFDTNDDFTVSWWGIINSYSNLYNQCSIVVKINNGIVSSFGGWAMWVEIGGVVSAAKIVNNANNRLYKKTGYFKDWEKSKLIHIVSVFKSNIVNDYKNYANGVELTEISFLDNTLSGSIKNGFPMVTQRPFDGFQGNKIDYDLKLFNKALTQSEVTQLYTSFNQDLTGLTSNLVANYDFNQKQGTVLEDKSPNGLNGTLTNFANTSLGSSNAWVNSLGGSITF